MAIYDFICPKDGTEQQSRMTIEEYTRDSESGHFICPECGGQMRRLFSPPAISIK